MMAAICGMPSGREDGVVAKDAAEVVLVGKDLVLQRQEHAGRIDEIDQRQPIRASRSAGPAAPSCTVMGKNAPAFTVASLAMSMTRRPATMPMPETTPAAGAGPSRRTCPTRPRGRTRRTCCRDRSGGRSVRGRSGGFFRAGVRWLLVRRPSAIWARSWRSDSSSDSQVRPCRCEAGLAVETCDVMRSRGQPLSPRVPTASLPSRWQKSPNDSPFCRPFLNRVSSGTSAGTMSSNGTRSL